MKKCQYVFITLTIAFVCLLAGIFIGRNVIRPDAVLTPAADSFSDIPQESQGIPEITVGKININTADEDQLMLLQGIGSSLAKRIIAYRQEHGSFKSISDIVKIEGIGQKKFESMKDYITVGGTP